MGMTTDDHNVIMSKVPSHYNDIIMSAMASHITSLTMILLGRLFRCGSRKASKLRVTGLWDTTITNNGHIGAKRTLGLLHRETIIDWDLMPPLTYKYTNFGSNSLLAIEDCRLHVIVCISWNSRVIRYRYHTSFEIHTSWICSKK